MILSRPRLSYSLSLILWLTFQALFLSHSISFSHPPCLCFVIVIFISILVQLQKHTLIIDARSPTTPCKIHIARATFQDLHGCTQKTTHQLLYAPPSAPNAAPAPMTNHSRRLWYLKTSAQSHPYGQITPHDWHEPPSWRIMQGKNVPRAPPLH